MNELSEAEVEQLRALLEEAVVKVETGMTASTQESKPVDLGLAIGRLSRVDAMQHQAMAKARHGRVVVQLEQIRSALRRVEAGTYGACIRCEEPIGFARLLAKPEALMCKSCQLGDG